MRDSSLFSSESIYGAVAKTFSENKFISVKVSENCLYNHKTRTIEIPNIFDCLEDDNQRDTIRGALDHEIWHAKEDEEAFVLKVKPPSVYFEEAKDKNIHNVVEDIRIERKASKKYNGVRRHLNAWRDFNKKRQEHKKHSIKEDILLNLITLATENSFIGNMSRDDETKLKKFFDEKNIGDRIDSVSVSNYSDIFEVIKDIEEFVAEEEKAEKKKDKSGGTTATSTPKISPIPLPPSSGDKIVSLTKKFKALKNEIITKVGTNKKYVVAPSILSRDELKIAREDKELFFDSKRKVEKSAGPLYNKLNILFRAQSEDEIETEKLSGMIDMRSLYKTKTDDDKLFMKVVSGKNNRPRVALLIDESGSMSTRVVREHKRDSDWSTWSYKMRIDCARESAILFGETLNSLQVPFAIYGFSNAENSFPPSADELSCGRIDPLIILQYKGFRENYKEVRFRLGTMNARQNNSDGDALLKVGSILLENSALDEEKILIVLSDGEPACQCYDSSIGSHDDYSQIEYPRLSEVVKKLEKKMTVIGIGIDSLSVKKFYKNYFIVRNVEDLPKELEKLLLKILCGRKQR